MSLGQAQSDSAIIRYRNDAKGQAGYLRDGILSGNRIRTLFQNDGQVAKWQFQPSCTWPDGGTHSYLDGMAFLIGAKLRAPGNGNVITPIVTAYREECDRDPLTGEVWGMQPLPGYTSVSAIDPAMSSQRSTWPTVWPSALGLPDDWNGSWYGYYGKGVQKDLTETFFVMDDSKDKEFCRPPFNYYPVSSDSARGGLGLRVEVRGMQWNHPLLQDILLWHYRVINISDHDYDSTCVGLLIDPGVGGPVTSGNSGSYTPDLDLVYAWNPAGTGYPDNWKTGYIGFSLLDNRESHGVSAVAFSPLADKSPSGQWPKNDDVLWSKMVRGMNDTLIANTNFNVLMSDGPFSLPAGSTDTITSVILLARDLDDLIMKKIITEHMAGRSFLPPEELSAVSDFPVAFSMPAGGIMAAGTTPVSWTASGYQGTLRTLIYCSSDGNDRKMIGSDSAQAGSLQWNTWTVPDGIFYRLRVLCLADNGLGLAESESTFTVNNQGPALPELRVINPRPSVSGLTITGQVPLTWIAGDPDGDVTTVGLSYRVVGAGSWISIAEGLHSGHQVFPWNTATLPNAPVLLRIRAVANGDTCTTEIGPIMIYNEHALIPTNPLILYRNTRGTGRMDLAIVDSSELTGGTYEVCFLSMPGSGLLGYAVRNRGTGTIVVEAAPVADGENEGPYFDGLRLVIVNDPVAIIDSLTGWQTGSSNLQMRAARDMTNPTRSSAWPADYHIDFFEAFVDTAALNLPSAGYPRMPVKFTVTNMTDQSRSRFIVHDRDASGTLTPGDTIRIIEQFVSPSNFLFTWRVGYSAPAAGSPVLPVGGDRFVIRTSKPYNAGDTIVFVAPLRTGAEELGHSSVDWYLSQNYPNPFNPTTNVHFSIPARSAGGSNGQFVTLKVFDLLGREVALLVNEVKPAGSYTVTWDASSQPSGVYFCQLTADGQTMTKKMILTK